eukprot:3890120-Rhodomonas_salina.2
MSGVGRRNKQGPAESDLAAIGDSGSKTLLHLPDVIVQDLHRVACRHAKGATLPAGVKFCISSGHHEAVE